MEFHWWYIPIALVLLFFLFGRGKGGVVARRLTATIQVLDPRFEHCKVEADYCTFKNKGPDHIEIEIERLPLDPGDELDYYINDEHLATVLVSRGREAEFDHWSDEEITFPVIQAGDTLTVKHQGSDVMHGTFR